jgi:hypothetical protein
LRSVLAPPAIAHMPALEGPMPTINEVWEQALQINANLVTVHHDLEALKDCCTSEGQELDNVADLLGNGFANLSQHLIGVEQRQDVTNLLLRHQTAQNDTIICLLDKIARQTCALLNEADTQTRLQTDLTADVNAIRDMTETVHPDAALIRRRADEARSALEQCCPPEKPQPPCVFEPCPTPPPLASDAVPPIGDPFTPPRKRERSPSIK